MADAIANVANKLLLNCLPMQMYVNISNVSTNTQTRICGSVCKVVFYFFAIDLFDVICTKITTTRIIIPKNPNPITPGDRPDNPFICCPFSEITSPKIVIRTSSIIKLVEIIKYFKIFFWFNILLPNSTCKVIGMVRSNIGRNSIKKNDMALLF